MNNVYTFSNKSIASYLCKIPYSLDIGHLDWGKTNGSDTGFNLSFAAVDPDGSEIKRAISTGIPDR